MAIKERFATAPWWLSPLGLVLLALFVRLATLAGWPFDGLYGQDPYFYDDYARALGTAIAQGASLPGSPWPAGYPLLVALVLPLTGFSGNAGQWVSLLAGALVAPLVYLLARELLFQAGQPEEHSRWTALVAGLLTAISGQLWQSSLVVMSDAPALCWATLSAWALVRYTRLQRISWLLLAAFALAWAVITRWEYALLIPVFGAYLWIRHGGRRWWHLVPATAVGLVILGPQWMLLDGGPASLSRPDLAGWSPLNALRQTFTTSSGLVHYPWPTGLFYAKPILSPGYLLPLFTPALILGGVLVLRRRWWEMAALLLGWGVAMYTVLAGLPFQNFRYTLVYLPPAMILTAIGLQQIKNRTPRQWQGGVHIAIAAGILLMAGWGGYRVVGLIEAWQADKAVVRWAASQLPADTILLSHGLTLIARHETPYQVYDLYELTAEKIAQLTTGGSPLYLLLNEQVIETQWAGLAPQQNFYWLRDGPGLNRVGQRRGYTLYRIGD